MKHLVRHVKKEVHSHLFDYLLLITAGVLFLLGTRIFQGERLSEFILILAFTSFYIIWGFYHHIITNTARLKNMIEYILIGFTVLFLIKILLFL